MAKSPPRTTARVTHGGCSFQRGATAAHSIRGSAEGEEVVKVRGGEAFDGVGGAVVDFHLATVFENHAAGKDNGTAKAVGFVWLFGYD